MTKLNEVFLPNDTPTYTYVEREELNLETRLRRAFSENKVLVSVSGPSKSGKTVLIDKCVPVENRVTVSGAAIQTADHLWDTILSLMNIPMPQEVTHISGKKSGSKGGGKIKLPSIGSASAEKVTDRNYGKEQRSSIAGDKYTAAINALSDKSMCLFIDDFHYINEEARNLIGKQLKAALEKNVKVLAASVPHRTDDVVRSNIELRGRVVGIDSTYWSLSELSKIFDQGFSVLNISLPRRVRDKLAAEAIGSPQLMQTMCLQLGYELDINEALPELQKYKPTKEQIEKVLASTASYTDFSKMFKALSAGPRVRGQERKEHSFINGRKGDVYSAILLAMATDPAILSMPYDEIQKRVKAVCVEDSPAGSSVSGALEQMSIIAKSQQGDAAPLIWDGDSLELTDPYFLFFLRCSNKL